EGLHRRSAHYDARLWGLTMSRERLYARIDARVDAMMSEGLLDEVRDLAGKGLTTDVSAGQAIGYKELLDALAGELTVDEAVELVKRRTRRYAKRQLSWFRHDPRVRWIDLDETSVVGAAELVVRDLEGGCDGAL
ncbi:MAG TPA: tRNA (adenosine(37)-N6)-dimethylallyltransferase MiaA, partial [Candidatus Olsenella stercoravium]|nr:tRNA (adenosine(37)-N6)-dimethylallyltransferase MiaA [Candidatus Olsenella stercoravium]